MWSFTYLILKIDSRLPEAYKMEIKHFLFGFTLYPIKVKGSGQTQNDGKKQNQGGGREPGPAASGEKPAGGAEGRAPGLCRNQQLRSEPAFLGPPSHRPHGLCLPLSRPGPS